MAKVKESRYTEGSIKTLKDAEAVRKRFGMYIGTNGPEGVVRLFYEAIGNAIDEFNAGRCKNILVKIDAQKHEIMVSDDGIGLFQNKIEEVCTKLHSGGKFEEEYSIYSIGQNGVGLTVINSLSESLTVIVKREGYKWKQTFSRGVKTSPLKKMEKVKSNDTGTMISFIPDIEVMDDVSMDIQRYLKDVTLFSYMNKGLTFEFVGIDEKGKTINTKLYSKNGMIDYMQTLDKKLLVKPYIQFTGENKYEKIIKKNSNGKLVEIKTGKMIEMKCEITLQFSKNDTNIIKSYCNGLETSGGGSHAIGFKMATTEFFTKAVQNSSVLTKKDSNIDIIADDIQEGMIALIVVQHSDAIFKSQTKDELNVEEVKWFVKKVTIDSLTEWAKKNSSQATIVYQRILMAAKARIAANRAKTTKKKQEAGLLSGMHSFSKIVLATSDDPSKKRMFIVEGDSAGGGAVDGRCPETDSIAKLRGKPLNSYNMSASKVDENKEYSDISLALGCGMDNAFDMSKLTHDQIIAMADADIDGAHITSLLANHIFCHMRPIIEAGKFYIATPPLYEVKENGKTLFFVNKTKYNAFITDRILEKYEIGRILSKNGKAVYKAYDKNAVITFLNNTERYKISLNNVSSLFGDAYVIEYIINNMDDMDALPTKIEKAFPEIRCTKKKKVLHVEGMYNDQYQDIDIDKDFIEKVQEIRDFIKDNKYTKLYYKIHGGKAKRVFIAELLDEIIKYGTPKYRKRFKGLGEMDYDELWYTTMRPESGSIMRVQADNIEDLAAVFETHFGDDADKRKIFLRNFNISPDDIDN